MTETYAQAVARRLREALLEDDVLPLDEAGEFAGKWGPALADVEEIPPPPWAPTAICEYEWQDGKECNGPSWSGATWHSCPSEKGHIGPHSCPCGATHDG